MTAMFLLLSLVGGGTSGDAGADGAPPPLDEAYGKLPLAFAINRGQSDPAVRFVAHSSRGSVLLSDNEAVLVFAGTEMRTRFIGADARPRVVGEGELPGKANYFFGSDRTKWQTNVPTYAKVRYEQLYPGIDLVYYGTMRELEYDFIVRPGADPRRIALSFGGVDKVEVATSGDLVLHISHRVVYHRKPLIYQEGDGARQEIRGHYELEGNNRVAFHIDPYDTGRALIIDPTLIYSTYFGESGGVEAIAVDTTGNVYVTGGSLGIAKLDSNGSGLVYSTHLAGAGADGIAVDAAGNVYLTGNASPGFPTTGGAFQPTPGGANTAFVAKLDPTGSSLLYSSYLGGSGGDTGAAIAIDAAGNAYVTGQTASADFPTTPGSFQVTRPNIATNFISKVNPSGTALVYSTFLGGTTTDQTFGIAADAAGSAYVVGRTDSPDFPTTPGAFQTALNGSADAFVTKLDPTGSTLAYSTYLGGSTPNDQAYGIAVDSSGSAYVTGFTVSTDFPTTSGVYQTTLVGTQNAFVTKLNATGSALVYSTYLGGTGSDFGRAIAVDAAGNVSVTGHTTSTDFPTTASAVQRSRRGSEDAFVTRLNSSGTALQYSSYLDGTTSARAFGIAVDAGLNAYVSGATFSTDFPTTPGAFQTAVGTGFEFAFLTKMFVGNTFAGTNVSAPAGPGVTVTFASVSSGGDTTATTTASGPAPPADFSLGGSIYYSIGTTATFTSSVTICIMFDPTQFNDPTTLQLFHFENNLWVPVATSLDPIGGKICGQTMSLSPFLIAERTPIPVTIAIKPMAAPPVPMNLGSSTVPVAILSTSTFDARSVDPTTVTLASAPVKLKGNGTAMASFQDVNGDGRLDLVVNVQASALQLSSSSTTAVLKARTSGGLPVKGSQPIVVVPQ